uniref:Uncharacterized protein n=1 Tax=Triticum urartu TaxID=4572 RepID=A0A8R7UMY0_TRIUA
SPALLLLPSPSPAIHCPQIRPPSGLISPPPSPLLSVPELPRAPPPDQPRPSCSSLPPATPAAAPTPTPILRRRVPASQAREIYQGRRAWGVGAGVQPKSAPGSRFLLIFCYL